MSNKVLTSNFNNLYNPIFCDLFNTPNGFMQYQNSNFNSDIQTNPAVSFSQQNSEYNCLQKCKGDDWCTSYSYDTRSGKCTEYTNFPNQVINNVDGINSGYNLNFNFDFNNLSSNQQNNVAKKCINQYLNNTYTPNNENVDLSPCGGLSNLSSSSVTFNTDPKCLYNIYNGIGVAKPPIDLSNYVPNDIISSQSDPIIDNYQQLFNSYTSNQNSISNINKTLTQLDSDDSKYNDNIIEKTNKMFSKYEESIKNNKHLVNSLSDDINRRSGIEKFENENNNNIYRNIFKFLVLFIIILLIIYIIIMISK